MIPWTNAAGLIAVSAAVTMLLRFLPFLIFGGDRKVPDTVTYLGKVLPSAIMAMLVVYCLRNVHITVASELIPSLIACGVVVLLHIWKRSSLLSIVGGTVTYMLLIQLVF